MKNRVYGIVAVIVSIMAILENWGFLEISGVSFVSIGIGFLTITSLLMLFGLYGRTD